MSTIEKAIDKLERSKKSGDDAGNDEDGKEKAGASDISDTGERSGASAGGEPGQTRLEGERQPASSQYNVKFDVKQLEAAGLVIQEREKSPLSEEYRLIKRPLLVNAFSKGATAVNNGNLIMITSALPGEGKTFTAINLSMSIALERDKTVLLVDADVARPVISRYLGEQSPHGLVDYLLTDSMSLSDVLLQTDIPNLRILPAGHPHTHSTELLASDNMRRLTEELATRYPDRVVIFDSPPLLATSEAAVLANLMGQVVLVVEAERTPQEVIRESLGLLNPNSLVSLILNKSRRHSGTQYYDYYGYYADNRQ